ncbi:MAG: TIGR01212 family radical SAM protein [Deltaproteobacteria bacterium]|nr:TIGR01212 family radical SAM protein [Deltaproteobacteria bacterium]
MKQSPPNQNLQWYYSFNRFLQERFGERVQKVPLDAGLTCPNRDGSKGTGGCIYCDRYGSGSGAADNHPDIRSQALAGMHYLGRRFKARKFIVYFQSFSNTYAPVETLRSLYDQATDLPGVVGLAVGTRPDCLTTEILDLLSSYTPRLMVWLELGLQSIHDQTLRFINRGHTYQEFHAGYQLARTHPLLICLHVIIGLPGENLNHVLETAEEVARLKPDGIKIHSLYINKGTPLAELYRQGRYIPISQQDFVESSRRFLEIISPDTVIQRLTGDPRPQEIVAPLWTLEKQKTLYLLHQAMETAQSRQGAKYKPDSTE